MKPHHQPQNNDQFSTKRGINKQNNAIRPYHQHTDRRSTSNQIFEAEGPAPSQQCEQTEKSGSSLLSLDTKLGLMAVCHPGAPAVIGQTRIYCHQGKEFLLVEVPSQEAPSQVQELTNQGWEIEAEIPV